MGCTVDVDEEMIFLYNTRPISLTRLLSIHLPTVQCMCSYCSSHLSIMHPSMPCIGAHTIAPESLHALQKEADQVK